MARAEGHRRPRRRHRAESDLARGVGGQCRAPLHPRRHPRGADRPRRRLGDGAKARPRRADHRHARGLSRGRLAGRSHHQGQGRAHGRPVLDRPRRRSTTRRASCLRAAAAPISPRRRRRRRRDDFQTGGCREEIDCRIDTRCAARAGARGRQSGLGLSGHAAGPAAARRRHLKSVPGSSKQYTQAQIDDPFNPPDWYPDEHPPMPQIVTHGGTRPPAPPARNAICRRATAIRNRANIAGLAGELHRPPDPGVQERRPQGCPRHRNDCKLPRCFRTRR